MARKINYPWIFLLLAFYTGEAFSQVIPPEYRVDWSQAGSRIYFQSLVPQVSILSFGGVADGLTDNTLPLKGAMDSFNGQAGIINFPSGVYLFSSTIDLRDSVWLQGAGSDSTFIKIAHSNIGFNFSGSATNDFSRILAGFQKGSRKITVADPVLFKMGNFCEIRQDNGSWDVIPAAWATHSVGQIIQIESIAGDTLVLADELNITYESSLNPEIQKINPCQASGISCMNVERTDDSIQGAGNNFSFNYSLNCEISGIESNKSQGSHCVIGLSSHINVSGCFFHDAFNYDGSGTRGYGVTLHEHASFCLIDNNIFMRLRHAMMTKHGSNGNVFAYNYSRDPFRNGNLEYPQDYSGDISLHGHYSFGNLFEGNIVQTIFIDHIWGPSGPYNTFFRNRAELYGIISSSQLTNYQNFVGNEISGTGSTWPISHGEYYLAGSGHFQYGNNKNGVIIPAGTENLNENSYYLDGAPSYWNESLSWPNIGIPAVINTGTIPAKERYVTGRYTYCNRDRIRIYRWNVASGNWRNPSSWRPERLAPKANDILIFDGSKQSDISVIMDVDSIENLGRLRFINNVTVTINKSVASCQIHVGGPGAAAPHFEIGSNSTLDINANNPLTIHLPPGNFASVSGNLIFQTAAHQMTAATVSGIIFNNGASFTASVDFPGNAFGSWAANSVIFSAGSTYIQSGGTDPFGTTNQGSAVVFQKGSSYKFMASSGLPDLAGKRFGNLEIHSSSADLISMNWADSLTIDDLTISAGICGFNLTGGISLTGNISVASGCALNFNPAMPGSVYLIGTAAQKISGEGNITAGENSTLLIDNPAGVTLMNEATFNNISIISGNFTIAAEASLLTMGSVSGNFRAEKILANNYTWYFLSSPVTSQTIQPAFAPVIMNNTFDFYRWEPGPDDTEAPWISLRNQEGGLNTDFDQENPASPRFKTGSGYLLSYSPRYFNPDFDEATKIFDGKLHNGNLTVSIIKGANAFNLIGNPYPSWFDFNAFTAEAGPALTYPAYWTVLPDGRFACYLAGTGGVNGASDFLAPMQGFFIKAAASGDVVFSNDMRSNRSKISQNSEQALPDQLRLYLKNSDLTTSDEVLIHRSVLFNGTSGAEKLPGKREGMPGLFTVKTGKRFCIDQISDTTQRIILGFEAGAGAVDSYTITLTSNRFLSSGGIVLEDTQTGKVQNLQDTPDYTFTGSPGDDINRFILNFGSTSRAKSEKTDIGFKIYSSGKTIYFNQLIPANCYITMYNTIGQVTGTYTLGPAHSQCINLDYLDEGIYWLRIRAGKEFFHEKVIITGPNR